MLVLSFEEALLKIRSVSRRHLLLGNGFSIALKKDIFSYDSLYDNADFSKAPYLKQVFEALETTDFEIVINHLQSAAKVIKAYRSDLMPFIRQLHDDAELVKDALVSAVAKRHPDRPYTIEPAQYAACRKFLNNFDHIFTLNYDVLLYWTLMQDAVDELQIRHDDGFRHPDEDPDLPYVSWQQARSATVSYLHGALHLFDRGSEITKYTWSKTDLAIVDQIRDALNQNKFPLFVSEGTSASKKDKILHNAYLHKALRSFETCCDPAPNAITIFGHSLASNDAHILRCIANGKAHALLIGVFGEPSAKGNKAIEAAATRMQAFRERTRPRYPLELIFYDAASAKVWG